MKRTCLLVILVTASLGLAQAPPAQKKPLDQIQVLALLAGGVPSPRVAMLVNERGINFEPNEDYLTTLKNAGAEDVLLGALRVARRTKPEALSAKVAAKHERVQKHLARGAELSQKKSYAQAEPEYRAALQLEPDNPDLHFALGYALGEQKKWDLAAAEYRTVIRLQPDHAAAHTNLGIALDGKGDL
jgi:Flp pilus assembly protein TadD